MKEGDVVRDGRGGGEARADAARAGGELRLTTAGGAKAAGLVAVGGVGGGRRWASLGQAVGDDGLTGDEGADEANANARRGPFVSGSSGGSEMERDGIVPRCNNCEPRLGVAAGGDDGEAAAEAEADRPERVGKAALAFLSRASDWWGFMTRLRLGTEAEVIGGELSWLCFCSVVDDVLP
jgi:hypothetical protein